MKTLKKIIGVASIMFSIAAMPGLAFAQAIDADVNFIPVLGENAFQLRVNNYSPKVKASFYAKYGKKGEALNQTTPTQTIQANQTLPWVSPKISVPGLSACTEYNFFVYLKSPDYPQYGEKAFGPYTYKTLGTCVVSGGGGTAPVDTNPGGAPQAPDGATDLNKLQNPVPSISNIEGLIKRLIDLALIVAVPVVALLIIWSGLLIVTARGNEEKLKKGKSAFAAAVIGGAIVLGAWVLARAIDSTIQQIRE